MSDKSKYAPKRKKSTKNSKVSSFVKIQIYAFAIYFIIFAIFSFISLSIDLVSDYNIYVALAIIIFSSFLVGFISGKKERENGLVTGVLYALPVNVIYIIVSLVLNSFEVNYGIVFALIAMILSSAIGGIVSVNIKVRK